MTKFYYLSEEEVATALLRWVQQHHDLDLKEGDYTGFYIDNIGVYDKEWQHIKTVRLGVELKQDEYEKDSNNSV